MRSRITRIGVVLLLLAAVLCFARPASAIVTYGEDTDWAGAADNGVGYSSIQATFTVPTPTTKCGPTGVMAAWIGLGGNINVPMAQMGYTIVPTSVGTWYEVFDAHGGDHEVNVSAPAKFGDVVQVKLWFSATHYYLAFQWANLTRHTVTKVVLANAAQFYNGSSAEWIVERQPYNPKVNNAMLSTTHSLVWSGASAGANGKTYPASRSNTEWSSLDASVAHPEHLLEKVNPTKIGSTTFSLTPTNCH